MKVKARLKELDEIIEAMREEGYDVVYYSRWISFTKDGNEYMFLFKFCDIIGETNEFYETSEDDNYDYTNKGYCFLASWLQDINKTIDWSEVKENTAFWVRGFNRPWFLRCFAKLDENGHPTFYNDGGGIGRRALAWDQHRKYIEGDDLSWQER